MYRNAEHELRRRWRAEARAYELAVDPRVASVHVRRVGRIAATLVGLVALWQRDALFFVPIGLLFGRALGEIHVWSLLRDRARPTEDVHADLGRLATPGTEILLRSTRRLAVPSIVPAVLLSFWVWGQFAFGPPPTTALGGLAVVTAPFLLLYGWIFFAAFEAHTLERVPRS